MVKNCQKDPMEVIGRAKGYSHEELIQNLPRHKGFHLDLLEQVRKVPEVVFRNSGSLFAKKVNRMMREISTEAYRAKQFTRTEINNHGVLYGVVSLKHRVIDRVLYYFHERWPQCIICLYNEHNKITSIINERGEFQNFKLPLNEVIEMVSKDRPTIPYFEDIQFSGKDIFETLYKSQFIPERENQEYFKKMIPNRCFELPSMRNGVERKFKQGYKKIKDFTK
jgi:hypothetical protein